MAAAPTASASQGRRVAQGRGGATAGAAIATGRVAASRSRRGSIRAPAATNRAGPSRMQTSAQASTTTPAATPVRPTNGMPVTTSPEIETSTIAAAVRAAWPAPAFARRAASTGAWPARSSSWCRAASRSA